MPGILAYRGGECFANLVSITSELPAGREWSSSTLEFILQQYVSSLLWSHETRGVINKLANRHKVLQ